MRQPDSPDRNDRSRPEKKRTPEVSLWEFEADLKQTLDRAKDSETPPTEAQLKKLVRLHCRKNAQKLGLTDEEIPYAAMYFFRLIYKDPANAQRQWSLLHEIAQNVNDAEKAEKQFDELLTLNPSGLTLLWRLVRGIVNGDYDVHEVKNGNASFYYLYRPNDTKTGIDDKNRNELSASLKAKVESKITKKPESELDSVSSKTDKLDAPLFEKILLQLQNDSDIIVENPNWHEILETYIKERAFLLGSTRKVLKVKEGRNPTRKERYNTFVSKVVAPYLQKLFGYCRYMIGTPGEHNHFAADLMLETHLVSNNLLSENGECELPAEEIFVQPWTSVRREIEMFVREDATMMGILIYDPSNTGKTAQATDSVAEPPEIALTVQQAAEDVILTNQPTAEPADFDNTPSVCTVPGGTKPTRSKRHTHTLAFHPHTTGELPPLLVHEVNRLADLQAAQASNTLAAGTNPQTDPTEPAVIVDPLIHLAGPLTSAPKIFNPPGTPINIDYSRTDEIIAETLAPYINGTKSAEGTPESEGADGAPEKHVIRPDGITTGEINSVGVAETMQYIPAMVSPNTPEEQALATQIKRSVEVAFRKNIKVINTSKGSAPLVRDLETIYKKSCQTRYLDKVFVSSLLDEYSKVQTILEDQINTLAILYEVLRGFINKIGKSAPVPEFLEAELDGNAAEMPAFETVQKLENNLPRVTEHEKLFAYLTKKGKAGEVKRKEHFFNSTILQGQIIRLVCLQLVNSFFIENSQEKYDDPKQVFEDTIERIKKYVYDLSDKKLLQGRRGFRWLYNLGRSDELKDDMHEYQEAVDQAAETAWKTILLPTLARFGKIMYAENK